MSGTGVSIFYNFTLLVPEGNPQHALKDKGVIDSGCSRHMTGNISYLSDFEEINGGYVAFGENPKGFCGMEGIKKEFIVARTPQQNGIAKRKNRTIIEAAKTMLADSLLPIPFWAEVINTACYVQKRVLVTKPHNKTSYELLLSRTPSIGFMGPFGCLVTILNTLDTLGKFDRKVDEEFLVGYSVSSKAFRVFNSRTRIVRETLHINFLENQPNVGRNGPTWLFDIDTLTQTINYQPVVAGNQPNSSAGIQEKFTACTGEKEADFDQQYVLLPLWSSGSKNPQNTDVAAFEVKEPESDIHVSLSSNAKTKKHNKKSTKEAKERVLTPVTTVGLNSLNSTNTFSAAGPSNTTVSPTLRLDGKSSYVDPSQNPDDPNMPTLEDITYSNDKEVIGAEADFSNLETNIAEEGIDYEEVFAPVASIEAIRLFLAYASFIGFMVYQMDVKSAFLYKIIEEEVYVCQPLRLEDPDYPDKVYKVVKALYRLHQALRAWYETLANYLLENGFQRGKIDQTLFIKKQKGDILLVHVYVDDIIFGSANKELCQAFKKLMKDKFQMNGKSASTPIDTENILLKDPDGEDVDVHIYKSMIGSLMYLTLSRPDIMFAVCACACFQVTPKASHLYAVQRIFSDYAGASHGRKSTTGGCQFLVQKQTTLGKDSSNPLKADNLPKIVWYSTHHVALMKSWLVQKQTAIGKDASNPFIVDSLLKTIWLIINAVISKLMLFGLTIDVVHLILLGHKTNDVVRLQALIDRRKVIITEDMVRQALRLDNADSSDCLPNEEIFAELVRMGKRTAWNEFSSFMASAVICLAKGGCIQTGGKIPKLDADEEVTLEEVDAEKDAEV
nr:hypothetical protein [Tanacetum cinerariifolium]